MSPQDKCALSFYRELEPIGDSGKVMLVRHIETGGVFVKKRLSGYNRAMYRYLKESHFPGIPMIFECLDDDDFVIVIEEYISGMTLRQFMTERGLLPESIAKPIIGELCDTLQNLHTSEPPIVCRDLKPENIILDRDNRPVIIDLDAAKFARATVKDTVLLGTPGYAAPEQFGFAASDGRTDVYALGVILNEMLTGKLPQERLAFGTCSELISRCTNMDPNGRPQSVAELRAGLRLPEEKRQPRGAGNQFGMNLQKGFYNEARGEKASREGQGSKKERSWLPPGFRSGKISHMLIALVGYTAGIGMAVYYIVGMDNPILMRVSDCILWSLLFVWTVAFTFNYRGIRNLTPFVADVRQKWLRVPLYILCWIVGSLVFLGGVILGATIVSGITGMEY